MNIANCSKVLEEFWNTFSIKIFTFEFEKGLKCMT